MSTSSWSCILHRHLIFPWCKPNTPQTHRKKYQQTVTTKRQTHHQLVRVCHVESLSRRQHCLNATCSIPFNHEWITDYHGLPLITMDSYGLPTVSSCTGCWICWALAVNAMWVAYQEIQLSTPLSDLLDQSFAAFSGTAVSLDVQPIRQRCRHCLSFLHRGVASNSSAKYVPFKMCHREGSAGYKSISATRAATETPHLLAFQRSQSVSPTVDHHLIALAGQSLGNRLSIAAMTPWEMTGRFGPPVPTW